MADAETVEIPEAEAAEPVVTEKQESTDDKTQERGEDGKFRKPVQPRIDELTRKHRESEREAAYWRQRAEAGEAQNSAKAAPREKPTPDKYEDYGAYVEDLTDWKAEQKIDAKLKERDEATEKKTAAEKRSATWAEQSAKAKAKYPDFEAVMSASEVVIEKHVVDVLNDSDIGPELAYHLDRHPEIAERLNKLGPLAAAREVGRIEDSLTAKTPEPEMEQAEEKPAVPPKKTTAAPPPAKPLNSGRNTNVDLAKAPMDEYVKQRRAQGARWAR